MLEESGVRVHAQGLTGDISGRGWGEEEEEEGGYGESRHEQGWMVSFEEGRDGIYEQMSKMSKSKQGNKARVVSKLRMVSFTNLPFRKRRHPSIPLKAPPHLLPPQ